jgi:hypothetical protein
MNQDILINISILCLLIKSANIVLENFHNCIYANNESLAIKGANIMLLFMQLYLV